MAGVVGRVDVDHLHLAQVRFLQELQHLQVVTFDVEVLRGVPVLALLRAGAQGLADGFVGFYDGGFLAYPSKFIGLVSLQNRVRQHLLEQLKIDSLLQSTVAIRSLSHAPGEKSGQFLYILRRQIRRLKFHVVHTINLVFVQGG